LLAFDEMIQQGEVSHGDIHHSAEFPVTETACGTIGPSAAEWDYVTCLNCLRAGAKKKVPGVVERLGEVAFQKRNGRGASK
jgi:hypothetical protein